MVKKVLLIDDDPDEHEMFTEAVQSFNNNFLCLTASNCTDAFFIIKEQKPDIIFLDLNMPGTNGIICLRKFRKTPGLENIPVYMYSSAIYSDQWGEVFSLGAKEWIVKPSSLDGYEKNFEKYIA